MNKHDLGADVVAAQLDRLAAGDLPEPERRALLAWLDEEPARWRACALAFLEAQLWEQAAAPSAVGNALYGVPWEGEAPGEPRIQASGFRVQDADRLRRPQPAFWLAMAVSLLVAFVAGMFAASGDSAPQRPGDMAIALPGPDVPPGLELATVSVKTNLDPRLRAQLTLPVEPAAEPPATAAAIPEYVRKIWERRGYELVEETRYLPAKMPDGRTVMVPVSQVHLRLKGIPVS